MRRKGKQAVVLSGGGAKGAEAVFALTVGPGAEKLVVTLSGGTGDGDLYAHEIPRACQAAVSQGS